MLIVESIHREIPAGFSLLLCIEDVVLDAGQYVSLWDMIFINISQYIQSHSLIYHMWEYNTKHAIDISLSRTTLTAQREGDIAVMKLTQQLFKKRAERRSI